MAGDRRSLRMALYSATAANFAHGSRCMDIEGGVAIVTGSSSGVGAACARQLAERGCHVAINYSRNEDGARQTEAACEEFGVETVVVQADVADDASCRSLAGADSGLPGRAAGRRRSGASRRPGASEPDLRRSSDGGSGAMARSSRSSGSVAHSWSVPSLPPRLCRLPCKHRSRVAAILPRSFALRRA